MKRYALGLITGILLTASAVMFIGATNGDSEIGRYQMAIGGPSPVICIVDTKTGDLYQWKTFKKEWKYFGGAIK